ncbi:sigma-70 family RNA polymerase sigma factor [Brevibacillus laterosporus]|uniref:sigma-70 family RNA polymerase sigma factor n=1 Tax=Brevibacillus laterosporus TaxID=1465 RepID=UPI002E1DA5F3|nr:sigma-70 family RNA polymerase sigma factor [Brevibacillus laterosporus]MED1667151.1 sigma-70 family RNA polymerase sigma factor [Brevibacillus laterosporus]MED1719781.1 sigma-70 family RNA polymerase sigma factor [Brevibacillus laterosporus]
MGTVKIDLHSANNRYKNYSFSSVEDITELLWIYDGLIYDKEKFNVDALVTLVDFEELIKDSDLIQEIVNIQKGITPLSPNDESLDMISVIAKRKNLSKEDCEKKLLKEIKKVNKKNNKKWINYIEENWKNKLINTQKVKSKSIEWLPKENFIIADFSRKHLKTKPVLNEELLPNDLQELMTILKKNEEKIKLIKNLKQKTQKEKTELRKRINYNKTLSADIQILKQHYGLSVKSTDKQKNLIHLTNEEIIYYENGKKKEFDLVDQEYCYHIQNEWYIEKVKKLADSILTDKQKIIFTLYFIDGFTQQEIADILCENRPNISSDLKRIRNKLNKNM